MISVIICTYNRAELLERTLSALIRAEMPRQGVEFVIVDNGSSDNTSFVIREFRSCTPRAKALFVAKPGLSNARNAGISNCTGDIIAFTDDDAIVHPLCLKEIAASMAGGNYMGGGGRVVAIWPDNLPKWLILKGSHRMHGGGSIVSLDLGDDDLVFVPPEKLPLGTNMWYRRKVFDAGLRFESSRGMCRGKIVYGDDYVLASSVIGRGGTLLYAPNAIVFHPVYEYRLTKSFFRNAYYALGQFNGECCAYSPTTAGMHLIKHGFGWLLDLPVSSRRLFHEFEIRFWFGVFRAIFSPSNRLRMIVSNIIR